VLMSYYQVVWQKHSIKISIRSFEDVTKFKYLGTTDQHCMHREVKRGLNPGNACYHSVQSLLSTCLLFGNIKVKIDRTIILPAVVYGCETWSVRLRAEHRLRMFRTGCWGEYLDWHKCVVD
jgi:hypothetical protein